MGKSNTIIPAGFQGYLDPSHYIFLPDYVINYLGLSIIDFLISDFFHTHHILFIISNKNYLSGKNINCLFLQKSQKYITRDRVRVNKID